MNLDKLLFSILNNRLVSYWTVCVYNLAVKTGVGEILLYLTISS